MGGHRGGADPGLAPHRREPARHAERVQCRRIGMLQSVAPFRDTFGKYIFGGILDRHPGLRIGYFEGGINWVPSALQDAEHIAASFQHLATLKVQHEPQYYWDNHMCASFMVDPLGSSWSTASGSTR